jgi:hypothetical protein|tara:strand:- start:2692 stop:2862 length:171 start_codon:yes stop_codon:yes gene_type:complete
MSIWLGWPLRADTVDKVFQGAGAMICARAGPFEYSKSLEKVRGLYYINYLAFSGEF